MVNFRLLIWRRKEMSWQNIFHIEMFLTPPTEKSASWFWHQSCYLDLSALEIFVFGTNSSNRHFQTVIPSWYFLDYAKQLFIFFLLSALPCDYLLNISLPHLFPLISSKDVLVLLEKDYQNSTLYVRLGFLKVSER